MRKAAPPARGRSLAERRAAALAGARLFETLVLPRVNEDVVLALAEQACMETIDLGSVRPQEAALDVVDSSTAHAYGILPIRLDGDALIVAIGDPLNTAVLEDIAASDAHVIIVKQARNFGQHNAIAAGLQEARGDIIVLMDSDLQDRPDNATTFLFVRSER